MPKPIELAFDQLPQSTDTIEVRIRPWKERPPRRWVLDLENLLALATPRSAIPAVAVLFYYGQERSRTC